MRKILIEKFDKNNVKFWRSDISVLYIQCFFSSCYNNNIYLMSKLSNSIVKKAKEKVEFYANLTCRFRAMLVL